MPDLPHLCRPHRAVTHNSIFQFTAHYHAMQQTFPKLKICMVYFRVNNIANVVPHDIVHGLYEGILYCQN